MSARSRRSKIALSSTETPSSSKRDNTSHDTNVSHSQSPERSPSPLSISRHEEKDELAYLNDRLAGYIDYVRKLEGDRAKLVKRLEISTTEQMDQADSLRATYEKEIKSLRSMVDDLANRKAQMEIEAKSAKDEANDLHATISRLEAQNKSLEKSVDNVKREYDLLKRKFDALRQQLDSQAVLSTELENRVTGLKEELAFKDKVMRDDRQSFMAKKTVIEEEVDSRKAAEYESRLAEELAEIRANTAIELDNYKNEIEAAFESKLKQMKAANADSSGAVTKTRDELFTVRRKVDELNAQLAKKAGEADMFKQRLDALERQLKEERCDHEALLSDKQKEVDRLTEELQFRVQEFTDLMNAKINLDQEILMYHKMLETEESRLKIATPTRESSFGRRSSKKRRLDLDGEDDTSLFYSETPCRRKAHFAYKVTSNAQGEVEFDAEQNGTGKWVRIINKSSKEVSVGGWSLIHMAEGEEIIYKFGKQIHLDPGATCTVWSSSTETPSNPPSDLVMKNQNFSEGSNISIRLLDEKGSEQASCTVTKERIRPTRRLPVRRPADEKCSLM